MKQNTFYDTFVDLLRDLFDAENQIVEALPKMIKSASHTELKEALSEHLDETKNQVQRLKKVFKMLNENPTGVPCPAMAGLLEEAEEHVSKPASPSVKDANIIICCQKVEHYEISSYGSARALARHLNENNERAGVDFDEIADILQATLDEESIADEKLTDIAEGGFFSLGINDEAESESQTPKKRRTK
ncbi:MAG: ferritin-like domain-containing protein [Parachlamydia sp.]|jgi:ferritin-like metal-binding protein YciE|nr:ferritin-like domain-containing protein [Parachlamydia sp.]